MLFSKNVSQLDNKINFSEFENQDDYDPRQELNTATHRTELPSTVNDSERGALIASKLDPTRLHKLRNSKYNLNQFDEFNDEENYQNETENNDENKENDWRYVNPIRKTENESENEIARDKLNQMRESEIGRTE